MIEVRDGRTSEWYVEPADVGLEGGPIPAVAGGEPAENAAVVRAVLAGETGPARDLALINAAAAIYVSGGAEDLTAGVVMAAEAVDSGATARLLEDLVAGGRAEA